LRRQSRVVGQGVWIESDADEHARAASHLADERMVGESRKRRKQLSLELARPGKEPLALEDVDVRERRGADGCVSRVGLAVSDGDTARCRPERLCDAAGDDDAAQREVPACNALCERDQVRLDAEALEAQPRADAPETADDRDAD